MLLRSGSPTPLRQVGRLGRELGLAPRDRALVRRLVGTAIRRLSTLRALVRHLAPRKPSPDLAAHLHLGLVQAYFLDRIPDHALVSETVSAVQDTLGPSKVRFVNAFLREALRQRRAGKSGDPRRDIVGRDLHLYAPVFRDPAAHPLLWAEDALSLPAPLYGRWVARHGEEVARSLAVLALDEPPLSLRAVEPGARDALLEELRVSGLDPRPGTHPAILLLSVDAAERVLHGPAFVQGRLTVQGETALRAVEALQARPDELILDLCAGPGGKSAVLAASGARVVACDLSARRLARLRATLERLSLTGLVQLVRCDGAAGVQEQRFDAVLVDAPCTNTGVLAARPEARWRVGPAHERALAELQQRLLAEGAARVRPGGRLVWSTCSLEPAENRQRVKAFLSTAPGWALEAEAEALPDVATTQHAGSGPIDGGYWARLRRA